MTLHLRTIASCLLAGAAISTSGIAGASEAASLKILSSLDELNAYATAINNAGEIVGSSERLHYLLPGNPAYVTTRSGPVMWAPDGAIRGLGAMTTVTDINESGQFSGSASVSQPWYGTAVLGTGPSNQDLSANAEGRGINDQGHVTGVKYQLRNSAYSGTTGMVWANGNATELPSLGGPLTWANDISNAGVVVGQSQVGVDCSVFCTQEMVANAPSHAVMWSNGKVTDLGTLGGLNSLASRVNEAGQIVGEAEDASLAIHAVLWQDGQAIDLGLGKAFGINNAGLVVGQDGQGHATMWRDGQAINLNTLLDPGSEWLLTHANGINDLGVVVGSATHMGTGAKRAFAMSLVPEAEGWAMMMLGFAALGAVARRRPSMQA